MEKEADRKLSFLDVLVAKQTGNSFTTSIYRKTTCTGLLTHLFSFTAFSCKTGLIKTLFDRTFKIYNNWLGFQNDFTELTSALTKNQFPQYLINRIKIFYLSKTNEPSVASSNRNETTMNRTYFKLPYIGTYSSITRKKLRNNSQLLQ